MSADATDPRWDSPLFKVYGPHDLVMRTRHSGERELGYPAAWERCPRCIGVGGDPMVTGTCPWCFGTGAIKHLVRELAGHRCIRCGHPYRVGQQAFYDEPAEPETVVEMAALQLFATEPVDEPRVQRARPVHYSPCDEACAHAGPMRARWRGGPDNMLSGWQHDSAAITVAGHGVQAGAEVQAAWRILTCHHANGHKADCRWFNLLPLCQRCHLSIQSRVDMNRVWPWEHSEWFRPYVAGWYAWRYLGQELTRSEVESRLDELLDLERQAEAEEV